MFVDRRYSPFVVTRFLVSLHLTGVQFYHVMTLSYHIASYSSVITRGLHVCELHA